MLEPSFMGLTFVRMPPDGINLCEFDYNISEEDFIYNIEYEDFMSYINNNYKRYSIQEMAVQLNEK